MSAEKFLPREKKVGPPFQQRKKPHESDFSRGVSPGDKKKKQLIIVKERYRGEFKPNTANHPLGGSILIE